MPLIWRGMRQADGQPEVGRDKMTLGVIVGPGPRDDLPEVDGKVRPGTGGMSVSPIVERLPSHRVPKRLREKYPDRFPKARGPDTLYCWFMGEGDFTEAALTDELVLRPDPDKPTFHGFVEPAREMTVEEYEIAIAATVSLWVCWEE